MAATSKSLETSLNQSCLLLVRLCGGVLPAEPIVSTGSRMLVIYKSTENVPESTGFTATYEGMWGLTVFCL